MLRNLTLAMAVLAAMIPGNVSAQDVNLHNGYIEVRNEMVHTERDGVQISYKAQVDVISGLFVEKAVVNSGGGRVYLNECCIKAGTGYTVSLHVLGPVGTWRQVRIHPKSCNKHGIPFAFAVVTFTGTATRNSKNNWEVKYEGHELSVPCP